MRGRDISRLSKSAFVPMPMPMPMLVSAILFASALLGSCSLFGNGSPPYVISAPASVAGPCEGYYRYAGVDFDFCNTGDKAVAELSVSFLVYDAKTKMNPFAGSNLVKYEYSGAIAPGETASLKVSLDGRAHVAPKEPYLVDFFTVPRIVYSDGTSWEDPSCAYYARSY